MASADLVVEKTSTLEKAFSSSFPNPFNNEFVLRVNGNDDEMFQMNVTNMDGKTEQYLMDCNRDHVVGQTWEPTIHFKYF